VQQRALGGAAAVSIFRSSSPLPTFLLPRSPAAAARAPSRTVSGCAPTSPSGARRARAVGPCAAARRRDRAAGRHHGALAAARLVPRPRRLLCLLGFRSPSLPRERLSTRRPCRPRVTKLAIRASSPRRCLATRDRGSAGASPAIPPSFALKQRGAEVEAALLEMSSCAHGSWGAAADAKLAGGAAARLRSRCLAKPASRGPLAILSGESSMRRGWRLRTGFGFQVVGVRLGTVQQGCKLGRWARERRRVASVLAQAFTTTRLNDSPALARQIRQGAGAAQAHDSGTAPGLMGCSSRRLLRL
jgi:hypothetical protein